MASLFPILRPLIHALPPETAHNFGLLALRSGLLPPAPKKHFPKLQVNAFGLHFANPIGLAAGFDKNAVAINPLFAQGFGFVEAGTVTPLAQSGNPKPRIFRLAEDKAVINRLGFNNEGLGAFVAHFQSRDKSKGIAGANIGKNKDALDAVADYTAGLRSVYRFADYVTINISSPNTQGLRDLQQGNALAQLLQALQETREECQSHLSKRVPLLLKVAPDLTPQDREAITKTVLTYDIDGLIVSNTTLARPESLRSVHRGEQGGLSGKPLLEFSTEGLRHFYQLTGGKIPLIGVGGIASAEDAYAKIRAGATLVQLYTALVYQGFGIVRNIQSGLAELLARDGFTNIQQAVGADSLSS